MEALSLTGPHQLLGKSKAVIKEELDSLDTTSSTPEERHQLFVGNIKSREEEFSLGPRGLANYTFNAVDDMWLLSRSAFNYLEENNQVAEGLEVDPLTTVMRSVNKLSFPAIVRLSVKNWENIKRDWMKRYNYQGLLIPEKVFQLQIDTDVQVVGFSSGTLTDIDSYSDVTGESGCPAKGIILNQVFGKYIDKIFRDTALVEKI
jgi:hypothetical protein